MATEWRDEAVGLVNLVWEILHNDKVQLPPALRAAAWERVNRIDRLAEDEEQEGRECAETMARDL